MNPEKRYKYKQYKQIYKQTLSSLHDTFGKSRIFDKTDLLDIAGGILLIDRLGRNGSPPPNLKTIDAVKHYAASWTAVEKMDN